MWPLHTKFKLQTFVWGSSALDFAAGSRCESAVNPKPQNLTLNPKVKLIMILVLLVAV